MINVRLLRISKMEEKLSSLLDLAKVDDTYRVNASTPYDSAMKVAKSMKHSAFVSLVQAQTSEGYESTTTYILKSTFGTSTHFHVIFVEWVSERSHRVEVSHSNLTELEYAYLIGGDEGVNSSLFLMHKDSTIITNKEFARLVTDARDVDAGTGNTYLETATIAQYSLVELSDGEFQ